MGFFKNLPARVEFFIQSILKHSFDSSIECPHCESKQTTLFHKKYLFIRVKKCKTCGLFFTDPIYKPWFSKNLYKDLYSGSGLTTNLPSSEKLDTLLESNFKGTNKNFSEEIKAINKLNTGRKLLEFGSSWGYFLFQASRAGFDPTGIEIDENRASYGAKKLNVPIVQNIGQIDQKFHLIFTAHTLEHLPDISTIFSNFFEKLESGGHLVIEVPNFDPPKFGKDIYSIIGAVHPLGFTGEFFLENLPDYGFTKVKIYESYNEFPENPVTSSHSNVVIIDALKP